MLNCLIIGVHQSHLGDKAGGYIRLKEFLKRFPNRLPYKVIDLAPSIYINISKKNNIIQFNLPKFITQLIKVNFSLGTLLERLYVCWQLYLIATKEINNKKVGLIYVPIGEFIHLYLPAIMIKIQHPEIKLVVDILNFDVKFISFTELIKNFYSKKNSIIQSFQLAGLHYFSLLVTSKTINRCDYIFTVSPQLVKIIKKIYKKKTIDFTPSGINIPKYQSIKKKYLAIYVGRLTEQKGIFNLINTWRKIIKIKPKAKLAIVGSVNKDFYKLIINRLSKLNLEKNVELAINVSDSKKVDMLFKSKIFLHLAKFEPLFPVIGVLEGLSCGLPVIVYNMPVINIKSARNTTFLRVIKDSSINNTVKEILKLDLKSKDQLNRISNEAILFSKDYNWDKIAQLELNVLYSIQYK